MLCIKYHIAHDSPATPGNSGELPAQGGISDDAETSPETEVCFKVVTMAKCCLKELTANLLVLVERVYIPDLSFLSDVVPQHIPHQYSAEMSLKSETAVIDVMMKNEACHDDMQDIMRQMQGYLGNNVPNDFRIASGLLHAGLTLKLKFTKCLG